MRPGSVTFRRNLGLHGAELTIDIDVLNCRRAPGHMTSRQDPRSHAMHFLTSALQLLDDSDAPADIGAHVQTAISRLSEVIGESDRAALHSDQPAAVPRGIGKTH